MKTVVLVRIDDRLIHGQVVTAWVKQVDGNQILIADDKLVHDRLMQRVLKAAAPPGIQVRVAALDEAADLLKQEPLPGERIIILVKGPEILERLLDSGVRLEKIILGGMGMNAERRRFNKNVAATEAEVACLRRLVDRGISIDFQLVPDERPVNIIKLL